MSDGEDCFIRLKHRGGSRARGGSIFEDAYYSLAMLHLDERPDAPRGSKQAIHDLNTRMCSRLAEETL